MKQGIQTLFPDENLRRYGCYFFCFVEWAERFGNRDFNSDEIIALFEEAKELEFVNKEAFIFNPPQLLNLMLGWNSFSRVRILKEAPQHDIYVVYLKKPGFGHFMLYDKGQLWDPLDPARPGAKGYEPYSFREVT